MPRGSLGMTALTEEMNVEESDAAFFISSYLSVSHLQSGTKPTSSTTSSHCTDSYEQQDKIF
jgi:hypothetical protein